MPVPQRFEFAGVLLTTACCTRELEDVGYAVDSLESNITYWTEIIIAKLHADPSTSRRRDASYPR